MLCPFTAAAFCSERRGLYGQPFGPNPMIRWPKRLDQCGMERAGAETRNAEDVSNKKFKLLWSEADLLKSSR